MRSALALTLLTSALASAQPTPKLAAPGLTTAGLEPAFAAFAGEHLAQQLREQGLEVVTSSEIGAVLGLERQKQLLGCAGAGGTCMAELANALGADGVVLGDLAQVGARVQLNVKVISAKDARVLASASSRVEGKEALLDALSLAAKKMAPEVAGALGGRLRSGGRPAAAIPASGKALAVAAPAGSPDAGPCGGEWCVADFATRRGGDGTVFELNGVHASAADNAWAVGYVATALRSDGAKWQERNAPADRGGVLNTVWGTGPTMMIAAGQNGAAFRWKGSGWQPLGGGGYAGFRAVRGLADGGSVWAASDKGLHRLEGSNWQLAWDGGAAAAVAPVSAGDVWAVSRKQRILHFDGKRWSPVDPGLPKLGTTALNAVWANGPDDVWMVGDEGAVVHYRGRGKWSFEAPTGAHLVSVWGSGPRNVWAAGQGGALLHWDGNEWMSVPLPSSATIREVSGAGAFDLWLVQEHQGKSAVIHLRR